MEFKYYITPKAYQSLKQITDYIAFELHNPKAAQDLVDKIIKAIEAACIFPAGFPHSSKKNYHKTFADNYVIIYRTVNGILEVHSIRYAKTKNKP